MNILSRRWHLSIGTQVALSSALLTLVTTAVMAFILTTLDARRVNAELEVRSVEYAAQLNTASTAAIAAQSPLPVRKVFKSVSADHDIFGVGLYSPGGELIEGIGVFPQRLDPGTESTNSGKGLIVVLSRIEAQNGNTGTLYVALSRQRILDNQRHAAWVAAATTLLLLAIALVPSLLIARLLSRRLAPITKVAIEIAAGDFQQPPIDAGVRDEVGTVALAINRMVGQLNRMLEERRQLALTEQERLARLVGERTAELEESREQFRQIAESTNAIAFRLNLTRGAFEYIGPQGPSRLGFPAPQWNHDAFIELLLPRAQCMTVRQQLDACPAGPLEVECSVLRPDGERIEMRWVASCEISGNEKFLRGLMLDITSQRRMESELLQAQKLESVGRLAAGIAHEINTPIQYVNDSVHFLRDAVQDIFGIVDKLQAVRRLAAGQAPATELQAAINLASVTEAAADLAYLYENMPKAFERSLDGLERVGTIVSSMKEFAHPAQREMAAVDLNRAIQNTLTIAQAEYKYVADLVTDLGELPPVTCFVNDINQVVLNMVVNAAHAIGDVVKGTGGKGTIAVRTRQEGEQVVITISDTGTGIPASVIQRIFDPFFTTKEVGRGTGQGLALAWGLVKDRHGGDISVESTVGAGTTFQVRLPIAGIQSSQIPAAA
jgi:signal transduction histidine kinase